MIYYLITRNNEYSICLVKNADNASFVRQCAHNILLRSSKISDLLYAIDKDWVNSFSFSDN